MAQPDPGLLGAAVPALPAVLGGLDPEVPLEPGLREEEDRSEFHDAIVEQPHGRGGAPPAPPKWAYGKDDLRAFAKYEQQVRLWEILVEPYMSKREAPLHLYNLQCVEW